ncbi:3186_t:CDS:2, partial [Diversispora eburnea]
MSATTSTINVQGNLSFAKKDRTHQVFFTTLESINKNLSISQDIRDIAQNLIENRKSDVNIVDFSSKKPCIIPDISHFCFDEDIPLQVNSSAINILEVMKSAVRTFNKNTIARGSSRSYKSSNHLQVDSKCNVHVPRESVYDAEMYRILHNWLAE